MDQKQIEEIVRSVMASMDKRPPRRQKQSAPPPPVRHRDLGKLRAGFRFCGSKSVDWVENPHRAGVLTELRRSTVARFVPVVPVRVRAPRRCCVSWRSLSFERYRSERSTGRVGESQGLLEVRSEISDKNLYLTRPIWAAACVQKLLKR